MCMGDPSDRSKPNPDAFLWTRRLFFRQWSETDLELALDLWGDERVTKFIDARGELTQEEVRNRLELEIASARDCGVQYWPFFLQSTGQHVGCCGLRIYDRSRNIYEIGFHIRADHWGQGFAIEAALRVMDYAFAVIGVRELFAGHNPLNTVSKKVMLKLGFRYTHDEYYAPTGLSHPSYRLTADEYGRLRSNPAKPEPDF
jgi:ribosomal-protein-alanine N-acetyltransferase